MRYKHGVLKNKRFKTVLKAMESASVLTGCIYFSEFGHLLVSDPQCKF